MGNQSDSWPGGQTWVYHADIVNSAGGAADNSYTVSLAVGNEMEILYGEVLNGDTAGRVVTVLIDTGTAGENLASLVSITADAGSTQAFPHSDVSGVAGTHLSAGAPLLFSGGMRLVVTVAAVALSQDTAFGLVCRTRNAVPTVVEAGEASATITINEERVF